jgi:hypothetical protein
MSNHKIKLLPFHPLADKFPRMEGKELNDLVGDIRWNGQRQPIDVYEGKIIDGITRRSCATGSASSPNTM